MLSLLRLYPDESDSSSAAGTKSRDGWITGLVTGSSGSPVNRMAFERTWDVPDRAATRKRSTSEYREGTAQTNNPFSSGFVVAISE
jgi:hypothetical protein